MKRIAAGFFCLFIVFSAQASLPDLNKSFSGATAKVCGDQLSVSTGAVERIWKWTEKGFVTTGIKNLPGGESFIGPTDQPSDWNLGDLGEGKLVSLKAFEDDDEHFTSKHLVVEAEIRYEKLCVKYIIWAYPNAPGLRTQLWLKGTAESLDPGISEILKLTDSPKTVTVFGYMAGLKANMQPYEILTEKVLAENSKVDWASGLIVSQGDAGIVLIKESHLHTRMSGKLETGEFLRDGNTFSVTGLGLRPKDIDPQQYLFCWATWMIVYRGSGEDAELAIKEFDRSRYPVHPDRDIFIMANTWGTEDEKYASKYKAREENVLAELESCAEVGIDILQIDDGWQDNKTWLPVAKTKTDIVLHDGKKVTGEYAVYPDGFEKVRKRAEELGVKLGLWHANYAPLDALEENYTDGNFKAFKLDFANLKEKKKFDDLYFKARDLIKYSNYSAVVDWDVTESRPRMGFYFGRDCGNLYLTNRKARTVREQVQYDPWQVLRDGWELAKYMNLNKVQLTYQNKDITPADAKTDAMKYSHGYNLAATLMSSPIFFTETQYINANSRKELKPIIEKYKAQRDQMYRGFVFAIGDKPDNGSWTGFQNILPKGENGYLTIFRELNNEQQTARISLHFLKPGNKVKMTNILTEKDWECQLNADSEAEFHIPKAPGFLFLKYENLNK